MADEKLHMRPPHCLFAADCPERVMNVWFWWFMLICNLLLPAIMVIAGRMMWKHCPKEINGVYGYRTKRSRMNQDTWKFAHEYCGRLWWKAGLIMLVSIALTERALKRTFTDEGKRIG